MAPAKRKADEAELSETLAKASARCGHEHGIACDSPRQLEFLSPRDLAQARRRHAALIRAASPELERLHRLLGGAGYIVSLSAPDAVRLVCRSDPALLGDAANYGILPGTIWSEAHHGPSSLTLALQTGSAVALSGKQHVPDWMHCLSCASAPVMPQGEGARDFELAGAITISTANQPSRLALRQLRMRAEGAALRIAAAMTQGTGQRADITAAERAPWPGTGMQSRIEASVAALAAGRPLLISGETGSGKTWLLRHLVQNGPAVWPTEDWLRRDCAPSPPLAAALVLDRVDLLSPAALLRLPALVDRIRAGGGAILASLPNSEALAALPPELRFRLGGQMIELAPLRKAADLRQCLIRIEAGLRGQLCLPPASLPRDTLLALMQYHWPGNGHEVQNLLRQALLLSEGEALMPETLPPEILRHHRSREIRALSKFEEARIVSALMHNAGNVTRTAHYLGVSRATLYRKLALSEWREVVRADSRG